MKISSAISSLLVLLPLLDQALQAQAVAIHKDDLAARAQNNNQNNNGGFNNNKNQNQHNQATIGKGKTTAAVTTTAAAAKNTGKANTNAAAATQSAASSASSASSAATDTGDPQTSLQLDPSQVQPGLANDGQDIPEAGQVPSLKSTNNFMNFCLTQTDVPLTNGKQIRTGSCNPTIMGRILDVDHLPSSKFKFPLNFSTIKANTAFTIEMNINNMVTGNFVNAQENYYAAPAQVQGGTLVGHSHCVIEAISSLQSTTPADVNQFLFFKGLQDAAVNGVLSATVAAGVPVGVYKMCSINTAANHQPALASIAQHASMDDCIYFTATADGNADSSSAAAAAPANNNSDQATATQAAASTASAKGGKNRLENTTTSVAAAATTSVAAAAAKGGKGGKQNAVTTTPVAVAATTSVAAVKGGKQNAVTTSIAAAVTTSAAVKGGKQNQVTTSAAAATTKVTGPNIKNISNGANGGKSRNGKRDGEIQHEFVQRKMSKRSRS